jgi:hypothetical protein
MSIWPKLMNEFADGEDNVIEDLIVQAMFQDDHLQSFPLKSNGSMPRAVNRDDYSRGSKEKKPNSDPRFIYFKIIYFILIIKYINIL